MEFKKITRVAIFVDYDNFFISYLRKFHPGMKREEKDHLMWEEVGSLPVWNKFNENLLKYYKDHFIKNDFEILEHSGTFICVGMSEMLSRDEFKKKEQFRELDRKDGFIIKYGHRTKGYWKDSKF